MKFYDFDLKLEIIDVNENDLPRELTEKRLELEKNQAYNEIIKFKDKLILKMNCQQQDKITNKKSKLDKAAFEMINLATK